LKKNNLCSFFKIYFFIGCLFFIQFKLSSQSTEIFRVKRNNTIIYFFQKNDSSNIIKEKISDVFYFVVPDSLKEQIVLQIENGTFYTTNNDSLFRFKFLRGLKYELKFQKLTGKDSEANKKNYISTRVINGASVNPSNVVLFRVFNKHSQETLIENQFLFEGKE